MWCFIRFSSFLPLNNHVSTYLFFSYWVLFQSPVNVMSPLCIMHIIPLSAVCIFFWSFGAFYLFFFLMSNLTSYIHFNFYIVKSMNSFLCFQSFLFPTPKFLIYIFCKVICTLGRSMWNCCGFFFVGQKSSECQQFHIALFSKLFEKWNGIVSSCRQKQEPFPLFLLGVTSSFKRSHFSSG